MNRFVCDKCGACCRNVDRSAYTVGFDKGNGVCEHFDEAANLCTIYETRPLICNVELAYEKIFQAVISRDEYYAANKLACKALGLITYNKH